MKKEDLIQQLKELGSNPYRIYPKDTADKLIREALIFLLEQTETVGNIPAPPFAEEIKQRFANVFISSDKRSWQILNELKYGVPSKPKVDLSPAIERFKFLLEMDKYDLSEEVIASVQAAIDILTRENKKNK